MGLLVAGVIAMVLFVWQERRARDPVIPLSMLGVPTVAICCLTLFLCFFQLIAMSVLLPLRFQVVGGAQRERPVLVARGVLAAQVRQAQLGRHLADEGLDILLLDHVRTGAHLGENFRFVGLGGDDLAADVEGQNRAAHVIAFRIAEIVGVDLRLRAPGIVGELDLATTLRAADAEAFVATAEAALVAMTERSNRMTWIAATYITEDTETRPFSRLIAALRPMVPPVLP